jgi:Protochlamydia outer membrane protein
MSRLWLPLRLFITGSALVRDKLVVTTGSLAVNCNVNTAVLLLILLHAPSANAQALWRYDYTLGTDYRHAQLDWNIAGNLAGTAPNVLSDLDWHDLEIGQITADVKITVNDRLVFMGRGAYGVILSGKVRDSDYKGDNRTIEYLRSDSKGGGDIADGSIGFGYHYQLFDAMTRRYLDITPLLGYSRHLQYLTISDGQQIIPASGPIVNLDSKYDAVWFGPWLGVNLRLETSQDTALSVAVEYHWADFSAKANWNLRDDLSHPLSFEHTSQGAGFIMSLALSHTLTKNWDVLARLELQNWRTDPGIDTLYTINTTTKALQPTATRLNEVTWQSLSAGVAAIYYF